MKWRPATWIYWQVMRLWIFSTRSMNCLNILLNAIVDYINIYTCKHFYGTCLVLSDVFQSPYHCYDALVRMPGTNMYFNFLNCEVGTDALFYAVCAMYFKCIINIFFAKKYKIFRLKCIFSNHYYYYHLKDVLISVRLFHRFPEFFFSRNRCILKTDYKQLVCLYIYIITF